MALDATKPIVERYLEDFVVGQTFTSGRAQVTQQEIQAFAAEFDPQPFHLDEAAAKESFFRGIGGERLAHCRHHHAASGGQRP